MPINDFLLKDETILASSRSGENATLYATNKRVIRYEKGFFKEKMDSLYYSHIVGASYEYESYIWLMALGIVLAILGMFIGSIGILLVLSGIIAILVGIFYKPAWYQLKAVGSTETEQKFWRTANVGEDARTFARFIQDQIGMREIPPPPPPIAIKEREVITKEIFMVKCDYCGALMPQTATFCPNCGAKRR